MSHRSLWAISAALLLSTSMPLLAADAAGQTNPSSKEAPVATPETGANMSNSGKVVPGQPIRPESSEEASVPKTQMDKDAASSADVGSEKTNMKANRSGSGADAGNVPKEPKPKPTR